MPFEKGWRIREIGKISFFQKAIVDDLSHQWGRGILHFYEIVIVGQEIRREFFLPNNPGEDFGKDGNYARTFVIWLSRP